MAETRENNLPDGPPGCVPPGPAAHRPSLSPEVVAGVVKLVDFCTVLGAALVASTLYLALSVDALDRYGLTALLGAILFILGFQRIGGYTLKRLAQLRWQVTRVVMVWGGAVSALLMLAFVAKVSGTYSRGWALEWASLALGLLLIERSILHLMIGRWLRQGALARKVVIVGAGERGERLIAKLQTMHGGSIQIVGVFDDRKTRIPRAVYGWKVLGTTDDLIQFARRTAIDEIIITLPLGAEARLKGIIEKLKLLPVDVRLSAEPMAEAFPVRGVSHVGDMPMLEVVDRPLKHWSAVAKWIEDKVLGALLLILLLPLMALIAVLIKLDSAGPVLFAQERFGFNNHVIHVLKFRTMYVDRGDPSGAERTVRGDPRVTRVGRVLRALSLDELPQLINVLRGEMSLVGPRPHAVTMKAEGRLYHDAVQEYLHRHRVKPGITGWAQVNGLRGEIDTIEKARQRVVYDLSYIEQWSFWFDLKILVMSFRVLLTRENAY